MFVRYGAYALNEIARGILSIKTFIVASRSPSKVKNPKAEGLLAISKGVAVFSTCKRS